MKNITFILFVLSVVLFSGCSQKMPEMEASAPIINSGYNNNDNVSMGSTIDNDNQISQMASMDSDSFYGSQDERIGAVQNEIQTVYFSTDSYRLSDGEMSKIAQNSSIFTGDLASDLSIKIEGNCDEWGTDEYNYALGLKRAKSVKDSLARSGVSEARMSLTSYGESAPNCSEHNAACWQQNRRVDFKLFP